MKRKPMFEMKSSIYTTEFLASLNVLMDAYFDDVEGLLHEDTDPYEAYVNYVRHQIYRKHGEFSKRFSRGYKVLLNELVQLKNEEEF